jgi:hypothetical protein
LRFYAALVLENLRLFAGNSWATTDATGEETIGRLRGGYIPYDRKCVGRWSKLGALEAVGARCEAWVLVIAFGKGSSVELEMLGATESDQAFDRFVWITA